MIGGRHRLFARLGRDLAAVVIVTGLALAPAATGAYPLDNVNSVAADNSAVPLASPSTSPTPATQQAPSTTVGSTATPPPAATAPGETLTASVAVLIRLFVLAVILESALAVIFTWGPYLNTFNTRTTNPLVMFAAAFAIVAIFKLDVVGSLITAYSGRPPGGDAGWASSIVTALVIAGGSAGVNRMLRALGYRSITLDEQQVKPPRNEAWLAVIDTSMASTEGTYHVLTRTTGGQWTLIGSLTRPARRPAIVQWLLRNPRRLPPSGGLTMPVDTPIEIAIESDAFDAPVSVFGPTALAARAILDIRVDLAKVRALPD